jgi:ABC-type transport system involved in cytochrome c biogenesis permease subunit
MNPDEDMKKNNQNEEPILITWGYFHMILPAWITKGARLPFWYLMLILAFLSWWLWLIHG